MTYLRLHSLLALVFLLLVNAATLAAETVTPTQGRVPKPVLEAGKGDQCVAETEWMRKNHMKLLLHRRDETMHKGIRTKQFSLQNCIECHASQKTNSVIGSNQNFCQSCHSYTAVKLDCFECHASKPKAQVGFHPLVPQDAKADDGNPHLKHALQQKMRASSTQPKMAQVIK